MRKAVLIPAFALALIIPAFAVAADVHSSHSSVVHEGKPPGEDALQADPLALKKEMLVLNNAVHQIVTGVALGEGPWVTRAIDTLKGVREKTDAALEAGVLLLPRNRDKVEEFRKMDEGFHSTLVSLAEAAAKNDRKMMLALTKRLLDGCVRCHAVFR